VTAGTLRRAALLLVSGAAVVFGVIGASGCGSGGHAKQTTLSLQREDLVATSKALEGATAEVAAEVAATKAAWPLVANGLSPGLGAAGEAKIAASARLAASLKLPSLFGELRATRLTGPAASIAGVFRSFAGLSGRGWQMIQYALNIERSGPRAAASFARRNVALYIESVYDAHFALAQIGKKLLAGWEKLGGPGAFGGLLPRAEVERLAGVYSEANYRLHPHGGVKLGS
jgi:outer membrane murein-binding lipoprotein Lpp